MKKVFALTINYKSDKETKELLESLLSVTSKDLELNVIVIDNYPRKPIKLESKKYEKLGLRVIYNDRNLGFAQGNNKGIEFALKNGADYVLIINNDTLVDKNFLTELVSIFDTKDSVGIAAPLIYFEKGYEFHKERYKEDELGKVIWYAGGEIDWDNVLAKHRGVDEIDIGQYSQVSETEFASGCAFLISVEVIKNLGMFDEKYFLYYEDSDLSMRIKRKGYKIYFNPKSLVWHKNASSAGGSGSTLQDYYITRNRLLFALKYAPIRSKIAVLRESMALMFGGRKWQKRAVIDFYSGKLGKGSYPVT